MNARTPTGSTVLRTLRDVEGVIGSFVLDDEGRPLASDLPAIFDEAALEEAGPRLTRLVEAFGTERALAGCSMRFGGQKLYLRPMGGRVLCVLASATAVGPALRMGAQLVARRLSTMDLEAEDAVAPVQEDPVARARATPPPLPPEAPRPAAALGGRPPGAPRPPGAGSTEPVSGRPRMYRGRRVD